MEGETEFYKTAKIKSITVNFEAPAKVASHTDKKFGVKVEYPLSRDSKKWLLSIIEDEE